MPNQREKLTSTVIKFYQQPIAKVSVELFLSIGAIIFFALFAIQPTLLTMAELIKEIEDKRQLNQQLTQKIAALNTVQNEYFRLENRLDVLDQAIPPEPQFEESLKIIEKIASDHQIVINSIQVKEIPNEESATVPFAEKERVSLPISIGLQGDFVSIRSFIEELRNSRRVFVVESITFTVSEERDQKRLTAQVVVGLQYYRPQTAGSTSTDTAPTTEFGLE